MGKYRLKSPTMTFPCPGHEAGVGTGSWDPAAPGLCLWSIPLGFPGVFSSDRKQSRSRFLHSREIFGKF